MKTKAKAKKARPRQAKHIREGSKVVAIAGNDRGRTGVVLSRDADRALVQGLNIKRKHVRRSQENPSGGVIDMEGPMHVSNLQLVTEDEKPVRCKVRVNEQGEKELYYKDGKKDVLFRAVKQGKE